MHSLKTASLVNDSGKLRCFPRGTINGTPKDGDGSVLFADTSSLNIHRNTWTKNLKEKNQYYPSNKQYIPIIPFKCDEHKSKCFLKAEPNIFLVKLCAQNETNSANCSDFLELIGWGGGNRPSLISRCQISPIQHNSTTITFQRINAPAIR